MNKGGVFHYNSRIARLSDLPIGKNRLTQADYFHGLIPSQLNRDLRAVAENLALDVSDFCGIERS